MMWELLLVSRLWFWRETAFSCYIYFVGNILISIIFEKIRK